ncbi:unnamed protein product [Adineta ricciae]|uniref:SH3 domain-containing protein n=1 Tax=Adineta ricciae TaxID=249248 RepID=A0A816DKK5_ADIRI|nr:unnamed protein product [Adineta ricciae]CAF1638421.1 unnamed protein product [Adineta ricciae]
MENKYVSQLAIALLLALALMIDHSYAGTVDCQRAGPVNKCAADTCETVGFVRIDHKYPSDCYVFGQPHADGQQNSPKWYRITLPNGKKGFVNAFYCNGEGSHCKKA